jgi:hypothetical protein
LPPPKESGGTAGNITIFGALTLARMYGQMIVHAEGMRREEALYRGWIAS